MEAFREYALSLIAIVLLCTVVTDLLPAGVPKEIIRTISGILITLALVAPLRDLRLTLPEDLTGLFQDPAGTAVQEGEAASQNAYEAIIKEEIQAYIQDKAAALDLEITAEVTLRSGDPPVPDTVLIRGEVSAYARKQLEKILTEQLGIPKENMEWTG